MMEGLWATFFSAEIAHLTENMYVLVCTIFVVCAFMKLFAAAPHMWVGYIYGSLRHGIFHLKMFISTVKFEN